MRTRDAGEAEWSSRRYCGLKVDYYELGKAAFAFETAVTPTTIRPVNWLTRSIAKPRAFPESRIRTYRQL
ncbi:hypothetical protein [Haloprofundus halophilus]|uniref:hypothetical protein n=1 Tax=Haloprofundus halophilus TaxID=2283527 RepID=UPI00130043E6|nr:hypothetical protein [Haloprofundus halophilus]